MHFPSRFSVPGRNDVGGEETARLKPYYGEAQRLAIPHKAYVLFAVKGSNC